VGHRGEVWSFDVNNSETRLVTCSSDNLIRVFVIGDNDKELHEKLIAKRKAQSQHHSNTNQLKDLKNMQVSI
jgi:WD40 repeat protein